MVVNRAKFHVCALNSFERVKTHRIVLYSTDFTVLSKKANFFSYFVKASYFASIDIKIGVHSLFEGIIFPASASNFIYAHKLLAKLPACGLQDFLIHCHCAPTKNVLSYASITTTAQSLFITHHFRRKPESKITFGVYCLF